MDDKTILDDADFREFIEEDAIFFATLYGFYKTVGEEDWMSFKSGTVMSKELTEDDVKVLYKYKDKTHVLFSAAYSVMEDWTGLDLNVLMTNSGLRRLVDESA